MAYNFESVTFPSADGKHTVYTEIYTPKNKTARGIVELSHGMIDHPGRYLTLIERLTDEGYIFAGHHHLGHGKTAGCEEDLGFFADRGGVELLIKDMKTVNRYLRDTYPTLPITLLGHSMGSFIARLYASKHSSTVNAVIIHGTGGPNRLAPLGKLLVKGMMLVCGKRHRSKFVTNMAIGAYNKKFGKDAPKNCWLSRDSEIPAVRDKHNDPYGNFTFTLSAYLDLFKLVTLSNSKGWYTGYPKNMKTLIMSGKEDPVGDFGRGVNYVYKRLLVSGCTDVALKLYEGARHELHNEINRDEVFTDILSFLGGVSL